MLSSVVLSLAVSSLVDIASAVALAPTTTATDASHPTLVQRDENTKTIRLGDINQYLKYDVDDSVEKGSVEIVPTGVVTAIPESGIRIAFGSDVQNDMSTKLKEHCKDDKDIGACGKEVGKVLGETSLQQHTKRFILITSFTAMFILRTLIEVAIAVAVTAAVKAGHDAITAPASVNFGNTNDDGIMGQLNSAGDASKIVVAVGDADDVVTTITVTNTPPAPTHMPDESIKIEEVTKDDGDHHKGDILFTIPKVTAVRVHDYLEMLGIQHLRDVCKFNGRRRRNLTKLNRRIPQRVPQVLERDCPEVLQQFAGMTLEAMNGPLQQLVPVNPNNPLNPGNNPQGGAVPNIAIGEALMAVQLARRRMGNRATPGMIQNILTAASIAIETVLNIAQDPDFLTQAESILSLPVEDIERVKVEDVECKQGLICINDDCKGVIEIDNPDFAFTYQGGICLEKETYGCECAKVHQPHFHFIEENYFEALEEWQQLLLEPSSGGEPNCDPGNQIDVKEEDFEKSIEGACKDHTELRRKKKRALEGWAMNYQDSNGLQWSYDWNDMSDNCELKCEDVFDSFVADDKCVWNGGMSRAGSVKTNCGIASYTVDKPRKPVCDEESNLFPFGAPRGRKEVDEEGGAGQSVEEAVVQFCNDIDGQKINQGQVGHERRFGFSEWKVPNRRSFWLTATYMNAQGCQGYEVPHKTNCKAALTQAMQFCSPEKGRTDGLSVNGIGCIRYSIHITPDVHDVHDDYTPYYPPVKTFPPPITAYTVGEGFHYAKCSDPAGRVQGDKYEFRNEDVEEAIGKICVDGGELATKDTPRITDYLDFTFQYPNPSDSQPPFTIKKNNEDFRGIIVAMVQRADGDEVQAPYEPNTWGYKDKEWCSGWDGKLGKDDCTYALRRLYGQCSAEHGSFQGGDLIYRCVHYSASYVPFSDEMLRDLYPHLDDK